MTDHPLGSLCRLWLRLLKKADERKEKLFTKTAREIWQFFDTCHDFMYEDGVADGVSVASGDAKTKFRYTMNKVAEFRDLFGPVMYHKNPNRQCNPRKPRISPNALMMLYQSPDPMQTQMAVQQVMQQIGAAGEMDRARGELLELYLNYTPNEVNLKGESRAAIDEALIRGRGLLLHEMYTHPGSQIQMPRSKYVSVMNLLIDPDATTLEDAKWMALRCVEATWEVERKYKLNPGTLKGSTASIMAETHAENTSDEKFYKARGDTHDLCVYWKVWTKCGMGQYLKDGAAGIDSLGEGAKESLATFGDYCFLVVTEDADFPLNMPPNMIPPDVAAPGALDVIKRSVQWPIPFWRDNGGGMGWPVSLLDYSIVPGRVWPHAPMKKGLAELKFLNWAMSFLMDRMETASKQIIAYDKSIDDELKSAIEKGQDRIMVAVNSATGRRSVKELIEVFQMPSLGDDLWKVIMAVEEQFEKRVNLSELVYGLGGTTQMRSASEAQIRREQVSVRIDEMAEQTEQWQTLIARREAQMARWFVDSNSVAPVFGEQATDDPLQGGPLTTLWNQLVAVPLDQADPATMDRVICEFEYRVEAGSTRKPNRDRDVANADQAMQAIGPPLLGQANVGNVGPWNALVAYWCKTRDIDPDSFMLQPPPPPQPPPQEAERTTVPMNKGAA